VSEGLSPQVAKEYLATMSKAKARTLKVLGAQARFISAMSTELGGIIMQDLVEKHMRLLDKVGNLTATDQEKVEYKVVHELVLTWSDRIDSYYKTIRKIEDEVTHGRA
jgi:hypothetical protein